VDAQRSHAGVRSPVRAGCVVLRLCRGSTSSVFSTIRCSAYGALVDAPRIAACSFRRARMSSTHMYAYRPMSSP
jgi:hypothetical protein